MFQRLKVLAGYTNRQIHHSYQNELSRNNPVDTGSKLNVHQTFRRRLGRTSTERLMYVQFTSCVYGEIFVREKPKYKLFCKILKNNCCFILCVCFSRLSHDDCRVFLLLLDISFKFMKQLSQVSYHFNFSFRNGT